MRPFGLGLEFRMELARHKPRMVRELDHFHQVLAGVDPAKDHAVFLKLLPVIIIEFIPVPVAFRNIILFISLKTFGIF